MAVLFCLHYPSGLYYWNSLSALLFSHQFSLDTVGIVPKHHWETSRKHLTIVNTVRAVSLLLKMVVMARIANNLVTGFAVGGHPAVGLVSVTLVKSWQ